MTLEAYSRKIDATLDDTIKVEKAVRKVVANAEEWHSRWRHRPIVGGAPALYDAVEELNNLTEESTKSVDHGDAYMQPADRQNDGVSDNGAVCPQQSPTSTPSHFAVGDSVRRTGPDNGGFKRGEIYTISRVRPGALYVSAMASPDWQSPTLGDPVNFELVARNGEFIVGDKVRAKADKNDINFVKRVSATSPQMVSFLGVSSSPFCLLSDEYDLVTEEEPKTHNVEVKDGDKVVLIYDEGNGCVNVKCELQPKS